MSMKIDTTIAITEMATTTNITVNMAVTDTYGHKGVSAMKNL